MPTSAAPGGPGFTLTINGAGFSSGATVIWNGAPLTTTFINSGLIAAFVPAANINSQGTASITVINPGTTVASNVVFFSIGSPASAVSFANAPGSPIALLAGANSIAVGDFNGDGKLDMAAVMFGVNQISILLGNGDGTFSNTPISAASFANPISIATGDFNGDGKLDLAVANHASNSVTILLGRGDGTFVVLPTTAATSAPSLSIATGDFNKDGILDLAVASDSAGTVTILLGNGDGTFTSAKPLSTSALTRGLTVADFNGDGILDLAVANYDTFGGGIVDIFLGKGNGSFTTAVPISAAGAFALAAGDFNHDGKMDLAVTNAASNQVTIWLGKGDGTFTEAQSTTTGSSPESIIVADLNGDGNLDLTTANENSADVSILLGNGSGTFTSATQPLSAFSVPLYLCGEGDFNGDGKPDLVVCTGSSISVLLQSSQPNNGGLLPTVAIDPGVVTTVVPQTYPYIPFGITLDSSGNLFVAEPSNDPYEVPNGEVVKVVSATGVQNPLGGAFNSPQGLALNQTNNILYVADCSQVTSVSLETGSRTTVGAGFAYPCSVALDGSGNIFVVESYKDVVEIPASGGVQTIVPTLAVNPFEIAADHAGTLFVVDETNSQVVKVPAGGGPQTSVGTGLISPYGVAPDSQGNIFITDVGNNRVVEVLAGNGSQITIPIAGLLGPRELAFDSAGNLYVSEFYGGPSGGYVLQVNRNQGSLNFANTEVGSSTPSQIVTITNQGSAPLTFQSPAYTLAGNASDFTIQLGSADDCVPSSGALAPGASCNLAISFAPTAEGNRSAIVTFLNNAANLGPQTVTLTGVGLSALQQTHLLTVSSTNPNGGVPISGTLLDVNNLSDGTTQFVRTYSSGATVTLSAPATASTNSFASWTGCNSTSGLACTVSMNADRAVTVNYVSASGSGSPTATLSPTALKFGAEVVGRASVSRPVTVTNIGTAGLHLTGIVPSGDVQLVGSSCPTPPNTLGSGVSCSINLAFAPAAGGDREASLTIISDDPVNSPQVVSVSGTGMVPFFQTTTLPKTFDITAIDTPTKNQTPCSMPQEGCALASMSSLITEFDPGTTPSTLDTYLSANSGYSELVTNKMLPLAEQCIIEWLAVTSYLKSRGISAQLIDGTDAPISSNLTFATANAYLQAHSTDLVVIRLQEHSSCSDFPHDIAAVGPIGTSDWEVFDPGWDQIFRGDLTTLSGHLSAVLTTGSTLCPGQVQRTFTASGFRAFRATSDPRGIGVAAYSPVEMMLTDPQGRNLGSVDGLSDAFEIPSGSYMRDSRPSIDDPTLSTGDQSAVKTVYAPWPLEGVYSLTASGTGFGSYAVKLFTVASDGSRQSSIVNGFAAPGSKTRYTFTYSSEPGAQVSVSQQPIGPRLGFSTSEISYAAQAVGSISGAQSVGVANTGSSPLQVSTIVITGSASGDFMLAGGSSCPVTAGSLIVSTSCILNVKFVPTAVGARTATLTIIDNAAGSPHTVALSGTGVAPNVIWGGAVQQPLARDTKGNFVATLAVTNQGNVTVNSAQVTMSRTTLGSAVPTMVPTTITNLAPGASATVTLTFLKTAVPTGATSAPLKVNGTYSAGTLSGNWSLTFRSVTLPH